ncbi:MAG: SDR family NAD(P)-dependent oxidoreductase [Chloroflexota bacterium]|nr:SDR family NAD(P)-dependent oxidoreductase [Chloroflexota bacterium]
MRHKDRVAIVTGAAQNIGLATAERLIGEGAAVLLVDVQEEKVRAQAERLAADGARAAYLAADLGDAEAPERIIATALDRFGRLDVLVNNAAPMRRLVRIAEIEASDWDEQFQVMIVATQLLIRHATEHLYRQEGSAIVNVASVHGLMAAADRTIYDTCKHAVIGLTRVAAVDLGPRGVRVNALCPGLIITDRMMAAIANEPGIMETWGQIYPLRRGGQPSEMAAVISFLASADASYMTGSVVVADGGMTAQLQENAAWHMFEWARNRGQGEPLLDRLIDESFVNRD